MRLNLQTSNDPTNYRGALRYQYSYGAALQLLTGPTDIAVLTAGQDAYTVELSTGAAASQIHLQSNAVGDGHI